MAVKPEAAQAAGSGATSDTLNPNFAVSMNLPKNQPLVPPEIFVAAPATAPGETANSATGEST